MKSITLLLLTVALAGCIRSPATDDTQKSIHYMQDKRTGLCFAYTNGYCGVVVAQVPCDKVQSLVENPWSR